MNERIKELAEQATQKFSRFGERDSWEKLFAELIVRECARVVETKTSAPGYGVAESWCEPKDLFEHFGVEE